MRVSDMTYQISFIFMLIWHSYAIDLDYCAEEDRKIAIEDTKQEARRAGDEIHLKTGNVDTDVHRDDDRCVTHTEDHKHTKNNSDLETSTKITTQGVQVELFKEYEYAYDVAENVATQLSLRQENKDKIKISGSSGTNVPVHENDSLRFSDYLNLSPALEKIIIKGSMTKHAVKNVWYVPENYPCWNLPFVYGKLGPKEQTSNVFLLYAGDLVVEHETQESTEELPMDQEFSVANRWCEQEPCYGDHTLCLFPDNRMSDICEDYYYVQTPNVLERKALVNTINSMRNRVAMGLSDVYSHLPTASNMEQIIYDCDLAKMASRWLRQCLPGPAACSSLRNDLITQLECTKSGKECCLRFFPTETEPKCIPLPECFVSPLIGCLHAWFLSAGQQLQQRDIECGYINRLTLNTVQVLWAETSAMGCAYGTKSNGDVRVVCNFAPGATFVISTKFYCGIITHTDITYRFNLSDDITDLNYLSALGIRLNKVNGISPAYATEDEEAAELKPRLGRPSWGVNSLNKLYTKGSSRILHEKSRKNDPNYEKNGTVAAIGKLVTRYSFYEESASKCDSNEPVYEIGEPGAECVETGRKYTGLCYSYRDPYPGYRWVAILAPVALFSLILYDLFSGVLRQTNF